LERHGGSPFRRHDFRKVFKEVQAVKTPVKVQTFAIIICSAIIAMQTIYMFIPTDGISLFNMARPLVYVVSAVAVFVFMGGINERERPVRKAFNANIVTTISLAMFGIVFLAVSFMFGAGINTMTINSSVIVRNLWQIGLIVILGEFIRYKLIKSTSERNQTFVIVALTLALAFGQMNDLRIMLRGDMAFVNTFFVVIFATLVIHAVVSYITIEGSFLSVALVSFIYTMTPYLAPIMPNISAVSWALIVSGLLFVTAIAYYIIISDKRRDVKFREKRLARYARKPVFATTLTAGAIIVIIVFFLGRFPVYPVVILSDSMEGTFERGALVFVERTPQDEAFLRVEEGDIIHFISHTGNEYVHRVVAFGYDIHGERVYITQGDAVDTIDAFQVPQENILGVANSQIPFIGYPYIWVQNIIRVIR
jgi:signal peptidase